MAITVNLRYTGKKGAAQAFTLIITIEHPARAESIKYGIFNIRVIRFRMSKNLANHFIFLQ